jgi:hypothetical protein
MSTQDHWTSEGFNPDDQPAVVEQVSSWMSSGPAAIDALEKNMELQRMSPAAIDGLVRKGGYHPEHQASLFEEGATDR